KISSFQDGEANNYKGVGLAREAGGGIPSLLVRDPLPSECGPKLEPNRRAMVFMSRPREIPPLSPGASNTLYTEGTSSVQLQKRSSSYPLRHLKYIFRPFVGYIEVRLVRKESKYRGGDTLILGFVDLVDSMCATIALSAFQGDFFLNDNNPMSNFFIIPRKVSL
ncbi:hypothetical protein MTR67_026490, partial [Solanum verrucosum]